MDSATSNLLTIGAIRRDLKQDFPDLSDARLKYALSTYSIEPVGRLGLVRVWHTDQLPAIRSALSRIANRREACHA